MEEIATYYVTLKPVRQGAPHMSGMHHIAYVPDPAVEEVGVYLNEHDKRVVADVETQNKILDYLRSCGQEKNDKWQEVSDEEYMQAREVNLTTDPTARESYNDFPKKDGSGQWLVRYEYSGPNDEKTRDFCSEVLSLNRIYTEEEIKNGLSNPEFGNYSIWDYKGSYGCRHVWKRKIFFEDYEDDDVRRVGFVPQVVARLDDFEATTLNAFLSKDEKMQVVAPLLIPDKDIFRNDEIGRYNMRFSSDTIKEIQEVALSRNLFDKKDLFKDTHNGGVAPSYVVEQWITESENDKAYTEYGFDVDRTPIGTWFVLSQITDQNYWNKEIKGNKKYAYSIEALLNLTIIKMSKMEKEQIVLPDGEHLINGTIYVVKDGMVIEKKDVTMEQEEVIEEVVETAPEEMAETPQAPEEVKPEEMAEMPTPTEEATEVLPSEERLAKLEAENESILMEIAKLRAEMVTPQEEEVAVQMSDNRPMWKRISDGLHQLKK